MAALSGLLNKMKRQSKTLQDQVSALEKLSKEELTAIAVGEGEEALRVAAIGRLNYGHPLTNLAFTCIVSSLQHKAKQRIAQLVDNGSINIEQLSADGADVMAQLSVVALCRQPELLQQVLGSTTDTELLYKVALEGASVKLRQLAAEKIDDEAQLKQLLKASKGKDKVVYRIVKAKCDRFRELERLAAETQVEIDTLCDQLELHSKRPFDKLFTARTKQLKMRWQRVEQQAPASIAERTQQALAACQHTIDKDLRQQADLEAREFAIANAYSQQQEIIADLCNLLASLYAINRQEADTEQKTTLLLLQCRENWSNSEHYKPSPEVDKKVFVQLCAGITFQLQQLAEFGPLLQHMKILDQAPEIPDTESESASNRVTEANDEQDRDATHQSLTVRLQSAQLLSNQVVPQSVIDARALLADREKQLADKKTVERNLVRHIGALIRKANTAIDKGQSRQAAGIRRAIEDKLPGVESVPAYLSGQLEQLDEVLDKFLDWKCYVVQPKKQQLVEQMQVLTTSEENPEALATKIRRMQDEWRALSKGGHGQDQELWESFHQLAQTAYQPCKEYYDQLADIRRKNLEKRKQMVAQLKDYIASQDWHAVAWKEVEKFIPTALKEWRSYSPTERKLTKPVQEELDYNLDVIRQKLNVEYEKNRCTKQQLIEQIKLLVDMEDNRRAVREVKHLQSLWKAVGVTSRTDDKKLWKVFRDYCGNVFDKRQQQMAEFKAELNSNREKALSLRDTVDSLAELSGQALLDARERVKQLHREFKALGNLPKAKASELNRAFADAIKQFETNVSQQRKAAQQQVWVDLLEASNKVRLFQMAAANDGELGGDVEALQTEVQAYIDSIVLWPKKGLAAIEMKISNGVGNGNIAEHEQALKTLCIRAEILADRPTPAADQALRMECKIKRLEKGLGEKAQDIKVELDSMVLDWVAVGPVSTALYEPLLERFKQCWYQLLG